MKDYFFAIDTGEMWSWLAKYPDELRKDNHSLLLPTKKPWDLRAAMDMLRKELAKSGREVTGWQSTERFQDVLLIKVHTEQLA